MPNLLKPRLTLKPFEYPEAYDFWLKQLQSHWTHFEVSLTSDVQDWKFNLSEKEKAVVGGILKGFTQTEVLVNDYWSTCVASWFKKPEIAMAASMAASFETIHTVAYSLLDETLGFQDYEAYLAEPTVAAKLSALVQAPKNVDTSKPLTRSDVESIALSLALFSAFAEGVQLFSSFAILQSFSQENKLTGVSRIVEWSSRDENLHSELGCYLFRQLVAENPVIWTDDFKKKIYEMAREVVHAEDCFIDKVFENGEISTISVKALKNYIRHRANLKLGELGLKQNWKTVDKELLAELSWFNTLSAGTRHGDFLHRRVSDYSTGTVNWDKMFLPDAD